MRLVVILTLIVLAPLAWALFKALRRKSAPSGPVGSREFAPASIELAGSEPFEIAAHLYESTGAPILDFEALDDWAAQATSQEAGRRARQAGHRAWLLHMRDWLGTHAELVETPDAWVLSGYAPGQARALGEFVSTSRRRINQLLEPLARFPEQERSTLITFDNGDDYYRYVANFYPDEGEFALSGGMFIKAGCPHFVAVLNNLWILEPVIAHEMTHFALAHLSLPLWLDEGLEVNTEHRVSASSQHHTRTIELLKQHQEFWNDATIQEFWTGESFHRTDEGNSLSYDLARAIVNLAGRDWDAFVRFATTARREDGGAAAAREALGVDLGELAVAAINAKAKGPWNPRPEAWKRVSAKA